MKHYDTMTLPLPLEFAEAGLYKPSMMPMFEPAFAFEPPAPEPARPYLTWRQWHGEEAWITRWEQAGFTLAAKVVVDELLNPEAPTDAHLWSHTITVHVYDASGVEQISLDVSNVQSPLYDLDLYPLLDDAVYEVGDTCVQFVTGEQQSAALLH